ncbi:MAG: LLM class flavin-dependent oxidoreductase [Candidatus Bathyarchaeia archaeon]
MRFGIRFDLYPSYIKLNEIVDYIKLAEKSGFDHAWIGQEDLYRDVFIILTAISINTKRIKLGPSVVNPYTTHPAVLAAAISTLNEISNGRTVFGIGAGGSAILRPLCVKMWDKPVDRLREAIEISRKLFNGEALCYDGKTLKLNNAKLAFPPKNFIPIYLAARGPRLIRLATELADGINLGSTPILSIELVLSLIKEGMEAHKRRMEDIDLMNPMMFSISRNGEEAVKFLKKSDPIILYNLLMIFLDTPSELLEKSGMEKEKIEMIRKTFHSKGALEASKLITDEMIDMLAIAGDVETVIEKIESFKKSGITHIGVFQPLGPNPVEAIKLIGDSIIPLFSDE